MRVVVFFLLVLFAPLVFAQRLCSGKMDFALTLKHDWRTETDTTFDPRKNSIGFVVAVVHNKDFNLFKKGEELKPAVRRLVEKNLYGPLKKYLEDLKASPQKSVYSMDHVDRLPTQATIGLNVKTNADVAQNTYFSAIGVLLGRPDSFFGISMNLCKPDGNFTDRLPERGASQVWVRGYDAGYDARTELTEGPPIREDATRKGVDEESREGLRSREQYATYALRRGNIDNYFPITFICLYPICCKKDMLDVPVPLQDDSQYAT